MVRVRFAPSPTGTLHIGGARTALFNYLFARSQGGKFVLRIDDTDRERSLDEHERDIKTGLRWLGMDWDEGPEVGGDFGPYRQSERLDSHVAAAEKLLAEGKAYKDNENVVRLKYPENDIVFVDEVCGECVFKPEALGNEPALLRSNGTPTYHIASVADDVAMGITHVIRGQDHLTNTAKQKLIFEGLCGEVPKFAHLPLILGTDGAKLSKRNSECLTALTEFKEQGYLSEALVNFLMLLSWSHPEAKEKLSLEEGISAFSLNRVGSTAAIFETSKLDFFNGWWIRELSAERIARETTPFLGEFQQAVESRGKSFWTTVLEELRDGFSMLDDAKDLARLVVDESFFPEEEATGRIEADVDLRSNVSKVAGVWLELLSECSPEAGEDSYSKDEVAQLMSQLKKRSGLKGKDLFQPFRFVVTGSFSGPDLKALISFTTKSILENRAQECLKKFQEPN